MLFYLCFSCIVFIDFIVKFDVVVCFIVYCEEVVLFVYDFFGWKVFVYDGDVVCVVFIKHVWNSDVV